MKDNVKCANCGWEGLVNCGEEMCPKCEYSGTLMWKEGEPREVEDDYKLDRR